MDIFFGASFEETKRGLVWRENRDLNLGFQKRSKLIQSRKRAKEREREREATLNDRETCVSANLKTISVCLLLLF